MLANSKKALELEIQSLKAENNQFEEEVKSLRLYLLDLNNRIRSSSSDTAVVVSVTRHLDVSIHTPVSSPRVLD